MNSSIIAASQHALINQRAPECIVVPRSMSNLTAPHQEPRGHISCKSFRKRIASNGAHPNEAWVGLAIGRGAYQHLEDTNCFQHSHLHKINAAADLWLGGSSIRTSAERTAS